MSNQPTAPNYYTDPRTNQPACVTPAEVALAAGISIRKVTDLLRSGKLEGEKQEGEWLVYVESAVEYFGSLAITVLAYKTMAHLNKIARQ